MTADLKTLLAEGGLMIVESPTKAREITKFLPQNGKWRVIATLGYMFRLRDPKNLTQTQKKQGGDYSVRLDDLSFDRFLEHDPQNSKQFTELRKLVQSGRWEHLYVSTDPDEAGELIGREVVDHLQSELKAAGMDVRRASWHEITKKAVEAGLADWGQIDEEKADSAEARQVYDRLFGFSVSHYLWAVRGGRSGGRAQSPCLRLVVDREKQRMAFKKAEYGSIEALVHVAAGDFTASMKTYGGAKIANGSTFGPDGKLKPTKNSQATLVLDKKNTAAIIRDLKKRSHIVSSVTQKPTTRKPPVPYKTSTFQQEVGNRLGLGSKQVMAIAQRLFESGFCTYLRTDSIVLSDEATQLARSEAIRLYGETMVPSKPRYFKNTSKNAQEGHEAIRPVAQESTGKFLDPYDSKTIVMLNSVIDHGADVYKLVWERTVASQMTNASGLVTSVTVSTVNAPADKTAEFTAAGTVYTEPGWMRAYGRRADAAGDSLPAMEEGEQAELRRLSSAMHETTPPPRFTEPQLVAKLEELGIGRPSTYASIVTVNQQRGYVKKHGQALAPTWAGFKAAQILEAKTPDFVAYDYTARMEEQLDKVSDGSLSKIDFLKTAWTGADGVDERVNSLSKDVDWDEINKLSTIDLPGSGYQVRVNGGTAWLEDPESEPDGAGHRQGARLDDDLIVSGQLGDADECRQLLEAAVRARSLGDLGKVSSGRMEGWTIGVNPEGKFGPYAYAIDLDEEGKKKRGAKPYTVALPSDVDAHSLQLGDVAKWFEARRLGVLSDGGYEGWSVEVLDSPTGPVVQAVKTLKNGKTDCKEKPVSYPLPAGLTVDSVGLSDVEPMFLEVKLPRWLKKGDWTWGVGVGKRGPWMAKKRGRCVFRPLPDGLDPRAVTADDLEAAWASAPASKSRRASKGVAGRGRKKE